MGAIRSHEDEICTQEDNLDDEDDLVLVELYDDRDLVPLFEAIRCSKQYASTKAKTI